MDNYQKVEQLVNKTGCSYEDAKAALEGNDWDMLDAVISLEREGKVNKETAEETVKPDEPVDIIPEVIVEEDASGSRGNSGSNAGNDEAPKQKRGLWKRIKGILTNNRMTVLKGNGQQILNLPIWAPILALICFFWATLGLAVVAMIFGCRFHFEGEDLGKTNINSTMDKATDYAEKVKNDLTSKANERKNTNN